MDLEQNERRLKVIVSEAIMVVAVILMVIILAFIVSGYWVNSDFRIERQGLLQISSIPTGADVEIDGASSWLQRTNTSKVLSSGEHKVVLTKEGYDSWSKTIKITEGLLYRLGYPRLFLNPELRQTEEIFEIPNITAVSVSQNRETMLIMNNTADWTLVNLASDSVEQKKIDVSDYFPVVDTTKETKHLAGKILGYNWDRDNSHILFNIETEEGVEWVLIDIKNITNSINLTKSFGHNFDEVKIISNSSSELLAVQNSNLHKIDLSNRSISSILVENVIDFSYYDNEILFSAKKDIDDTYYLGILKLNSDKMIELSTLAAPAKVAISRFYEDKYITIITERTVSIYKKEDFSEFASFELKFTPETTKVGHGGGFIMLSTGDNIATIDMESLDLLEWQVEGDTFGWLEDSMIYTVLDDELIVYDFDGLNRRVITKNVSANFPITITDDKWLYYFNDDNLMRQWLVPR